MVKLSMAVMALMAFMVIISVVDCSEESPRSSRRRNRNRSKLRRRRPSRNRNRHRGRVRAKAIPPPVEVTTEIATTTAMVTEAIEATEALFAQEVTENEADPTASVSSEGTTPAAKSDVASSEAENAAPPVPRAPPRRGLTVDDCGECDSQFCPPIAESSCPTGLVKDKCSCCLTCGAGVGNRCYNASANMPDNPNIGVCGPGLSCILRDDLGPHEPMEALCECNEKRMVCGSDQTSYKSECHFREAAHSNPELVIKSMEPCVTAPWIPNPIENVTAESGEDVSMSCEVHGSPPPIIHWEFFGSKPNQTPKILPGDDSAVVIVVRGGPEEIMTTSWIQIISVGKSRHGTYVCVAENSEGKAQSVAKITLN